MHQHLHYWGPRGRREKGPETLFKEIIAEIFLNMGKEIVKQVQEAQSYVPGRIYSRRSAQRHRIRLTHNHTDTN